MYSFGVDSGLDTYAMYILPHALVSIACPIKGTQLSLLFAIFLSTMFGFWCVTS